MNEYPPVVAPRRSRFVRAGLAASTALVLALAACGGGSDGNEPTSSETAGGLVDVQTVADQQAFDPIDPHVSSNGVTISIGWYVFEALYQAEVESPTTFYPALAAGEAEKVDETTYKVKIRPGATFHDGSSVTADDVAFSFNRMIGFGPDATLGKYLTNFKSIEATADDEVTFSLNTPTALFKERLSTVKIIPRASVEGPNSEAALSYEPIGSGPYRVTSADPETGAVLERFEDYNGPLADKLVAETINYEIITDGNARVAALQAGEVDAIKAPPRSAVAELRSADEFEVAPTPSLSTHLFFVNAGKPPFDDPLVRQAVSYAIDREAVAEVAYDGLAQPADLLVTEDNADYAPPSAAPTHDVEKAKDLLAQAGMPDGFSFEFQVPTDDTAQTSAGQQIQAQLAEAGITAEIRAGDLGGLYERVLDGNFEAMYAGTSPALLGSADAEFLYRWLYYGSFVDDYTYWSGSKREQVEDLLDAAVAAPTREEYESLMKQVYDITTDVGPIIPVVHNDQVVAWNSATAAGITQSPIGLLVVAKDA